MNEEISEEEQQLIETDLRLLLADHPPQYLLGYADFYDHRLKVCLLYTSLFVQVEPFKEWVIDDSQRKNKEIQLNGVLYVDDLEPYIERKLFSVNTGHATVAYTGALLGLSLIHI